MTKTKLSFSTNFLLPHYQTKHPMALTFSFLFLATLKPFTSVWDSNLGKTHSLPTLITHQVTGLNEAEVLDVSSQEKYDKPRQRIKKQRHYFTDKGPYSQSYGFSSSHVWM